ncbi:MAG: hypothetical protein ACYSWZ_00665 [Planctomycetota bacterium]
MFKRCAPTCPHEKLHLDGDMRPSALVNRTSDLFFSPSNAPFSPPDDYNLLGLMVIGLNILLPL